MSHAFPSEEFIAIGWVLLAVLNGYVACGERGWSRLWHWCVCVLCAILTFAYGYSAFTHMVSHRAVP